MDLLTRVATGSAKQWMLADAIAKHYEARVKAYGHSVGAETPFHAAPSRAACTVQAARRLLRA